MSMDRMKVARSEEIKKFKQKISELENYVQESDDKNGRSLDNLRSANQTIRNLTERNKGKEESNELESKVKGLLDRQLEQAKMLAKLIEVSSEHLDTLSRHERFIEELGSKERNEP